MHMTYHGHDQCGKCCRENISDMTYQENDAHDISWTRHTGTWCRRHINDILQTKDQGHVGDDISWTRHIWDILQAKYKGHDISGK